MLCPRCSRQIPDDAILCCYCGRTIVRRPQSKVHQRPNGTGSVYKARPDASTWTACVTLSYFVDSSGKRRLKRRKKSGFATKAEALRYLESLRTQQETKSAPPLAYYWDLYSNGELTKLSDGKITAYNIAWRRAAAIANMRVDQITIADLRNCVESNAHTYYPARDMKVVFTHMFRLAAADGWANKDLPSFINLPDLKEEGRESFTQEEQAALWRVYESGNADAAIPLIMIYTGMMTGELRRLTVDMIHFDTNQIEGVGLKTKVRKAAPVFFPDDIRPVLEDLCAGREGLVYPDREETFYNRYYAALAAAGARRLTPYCCRHTTATRLAVTNAIAPQTVQKIMRWSSTKMLDRYAHPDTADAIAAIQSLNQPEGGKSSSGSTGKSASENPKEQQGEQRVEQ